MSHPLPHDFDDDEPILKPQARPRRPFEVGAPSNPNSAPPTPPQDPQAFPPNNHVHGLEPLRTNMASESNGGSTTPSRTKSFLNLTTSTLFGIYEPSGFETQNPTPWGTGAQTPADSHSTSLQGSFDWSRVKLPAGEFSKGVDGKIRRRSTAHQLQRQPTVRKGFKGYLLPLFGRTLALFGVGLLYGLLISHLHDRQQLAPVKVNLDRSRWSYLATWGVIGVLLGEALPWADMLWAPDEDAIKEEESESDAELRKTNDARGANGWLQIVRSIAAFVGIAFAIRKLPWKSTLQLSLTLALANPAVWYLIDRSPPGFILSTLVALSGTAVLLGINPTLVPPPSPVQVLQDHATKHGSLHNGTLNELGDEQLVFGIFTQESVGVATWVASVLFVSCVCFGNIGRRLSPQRV